MRPVRKWAVGQEFNRNENPETVLARYVRYQNANPILQKNLGHFCSYCEVFSPDLEVEHIISRDQDPSLETDWENFLLACGRCNGRDNKSNKPVNLNDIYLPHLHNTFLIFEYKEGGFVGIHPQLTDPSQINRATALMSLVGLDKYPGSTNYPATIIHPMGFPETDKRWEHRRTAWEKAQRKLHAFENGEIDASTVAAFALERGFFSVWFSVFHAHQQVKQELIARFTGTETNCFDPVTFNPISRNPPNTL